jgi:hypothetical protein
MSGQYEPAGNALFRAIALVVLVAVGAKVAWTLLAPLLPHLIAGLLLIGVFALLVGRRPR